MNDKIYIVECLNFNLTTENYKIDTEKLQTWEKATFSWPPEPTKFVFNKNFFKNPPATKIVSIYQNILILRSSSIVVMIPKGITLSRLGENKTHLIADIRCKWTPLFLQGKHYITTTFWIPDGSPYKSDCGLLRIYSR